MIESILNQFSSIPQTYGVVLALVSALLGALIIVLYSGFVPKSKPPKKARGVIGNVELELYVAESFWDKYSGLSSFDSLGNNEGLLLKDLGGNFFVNDQRISMRNMDFPIDVIVLNESLRVVDIQKLDQPRSKLQYYFGYDQVDIDGRHVIEVPSGVGDSIENGDKLEIK